MRVRALANPVNGVPTSIHDDYRYLERRSRQGRYMLRTFGSQDVRDLLDQEPAAIATFAGM
jgi:hypothetical protein